MYILLRKDLLTELKWPIGAVATQAAHAASACIWTFRDDPDVMAYMKDLEHMRKVTLAIKDEAELRTMEEQLKSGGVQYYCWIEDDQAVCIAIKPMERGSVSGLVRHLSLFQ